MKFPALVRSVTWAASPEIILFRGPCKFFYIKLSNVICCIQCHDMCCLLDAFCCILKSRHMLRHWTVYSWGLDKNYTLALRILEQRSGGRVAAKIDCARPCFFHLPSFKMPMQWHHYERFSSATIPRTKETMCPRSEDAKVYKVDVQKRDIPNIYLSILLLTTCYCLMKSGKATST